MTDAKGHGYKVTQFILGLNAAVRDIVNQVSTIMFNFRHHGNGGQRTWQHHNTGGNSCTRGNSSPTIAPSAADNTIPTANHGTQQGGSGNDGTARHQEPHGSGGTAPQPHHGQVASVGTGRQGREPNRDNQWDESVRRTTTLAAAPPDNGAGVLKWLEDEETVQFYSSVPLCSLRGGGSIETDLQVTESSHSEDAPPAHDGPDPEYQASDGYWDWLGDDTRQRSGEQPRPQPPTITGTRGEVPIIVCTGCCRDVPIRGLTWRQCRCPAFRCQACAPIPCPRCNAAAKEDLDDPEGDMGHHRPLINGTSADIANGHSTAPREGGQQRRLQVVNDLRLGLHYDDR